MDITEKGFEATIEAALIGGEMAADMPTAVSYAPGGYVRREPEQYDRELCLDPEMTVAFVQGTQPKEWQKLANLHKTEARARFLTTLSERVAKFGTLEILRRGLRMDGCRFALAYFLPSSGLNQDILDRYRGNIFSVVRQLKFSTKTEESIDLVLFLNGLPIFTAELKNPLTGQNVQHAIRQYRFDRDPREPLFRHGRCLAHFAVDPDLVYMTTHLRGADTRFLPFNRGNRGGAGNEPSATGFATAYLWEYVWTKDSVLSLLHDFIQEVEEEDEDGRKTGKKSLIFPRYHQLDCVRRLVADAKEFGTGRSYLVQHSAGSGKSYSISWLAHHLSVLHDAKDKRVFNSVIVISDRRVIDRQLQAAVSQFEQTPGVVENIDQTSRQLKQALESGKNIIVTTLQKFPVIVNQIGEMPGTRFAVIIDEAHSSQSGESTRSLKEVLRVETLEKADEIEGGELEDEEDRILQQMKTRQRLPNVSYFAFTATPKNKTLELFGHKRPDGKFEPFSLYSMRQAIEEGFILDVLANYTTYKEYWSLLKKIANDPRYDRKKAQFLLKKFVAIHEHTVNEKVAVIVEHFRDRVAGRIGGKAKAMIVTRSRLHAVRYFRALKEYLQKHGLGYKALVAFSGTVHDQGQDYTEAGLNGLPEAQT
ncbi:MAG: type I restriction endonuclease, partial [candidate division WOR-3 bacterium]